jgi:hypothetical protein
MSALRDKMRAIESDLVALDLKADRFVSRAVMEGHDTALAVSTIISLHLKAARDVADRWMREEASK